MIQPQAAVWVLLALVAVVQVGRLTTYMTYTNSDWSLSTRHPFYFNPAFTSPSIRLSV